MGQRIPSSADVILASPLACISWDGGLPVVDRVHVAQGISTVLQSAAMRQGEELAASIPANTSAVLNIRIGKGAAPRLKVGGRTISHAYGVGEGSLMAPGTETCWSLRHDPGGGWFNIIFDETLLRLLEDTGGTPIRTVPYVADRVIGAIAQMFFDLTGKDETPDPLLWQSLGNVLLWRLSLLESGSEPAPVRGGLAPWQAKRTTEYLAENLDRRVTLDELAAVAKLSPFHFSRAFARTMGVPPYRYQQKLRMERARELLARTDMRVIEVALAVGYESPQALSRVFTQAHGMTPSRWRRQHRGG